MERFEPRKFILRKSQALRSQSGEGKVLVAVSGGLKSLVCFEIARNAKIREQDQVIPFMIDTGLLRAEIDKDNNIIQTEIKQTEEYFRKRYNITLERWDEQEKFLTALKGVVLPDEKRKIFRDVFYKILSQAMRSYSADIIVQGTTLSEIIETQKGIKIHFNVLHEAGINPQLYGVQIFEPLKELTRTRVKMLARSLSIPQKYIQAQPFPGPGFAVRITGEVTRERIEKIRKATYIVESEISSARIFQYFPVLLVDRVTGIHNDTSVTGDIIAIRIVETSKDSLGAKPYRMPWPKIEKITKRILNEVPGVVRVLYDVTPKPPGTIEFA